MVSVVDGSAKSPGDRRISPEMAGRFAEADRELIKSYARHVVDLALHNTLELFSAGADVELTARGEDGSRVNVAECSDGLSGEVYSRGGWIARYSKHEAGMR